MHMGSVRLFPKLGVPHLVLLFGFGAFMLDGFSDRGLDFCLLFDSCRLGVAYFIYRCSFWSGTSSSDLECDVYLQVAPAGKVQYGFVRKFARLKNNLHGDLHNWCYLLKNRIVNHSKNTICAAL